ncbi:hypothetical protein RRF57_013393 [Xylaria bambusicola]|uniref:Uncharacterized protein n=1 Tax=Xylaria bambusicola TaxID=326684 RepID=A0AAN7UY14_9PEZI
MAPIFVPGPRYDWHFRRLREGLNIRIEPIKNDNAHSADASDVQNYYQLIACPYGWAEDFVLQDWLLKRTGDIMGDEVHLRAVGRRDDLIVLATGEKVLPRILERALEESSHIKTAVAFGEGQFEIGVIVEAGKQMDSHSKISNPDGIVVATPERKIRPSDKGSVSRKEVYQQFNAQIRQACKIMEKGSKGRQLHFLDEQQP